MPSANTPTPNNYPNDNLGAFIERAVNLAQANWAAPVAGGAGPINVVAGFVDPSAVEASRFPEISLTVGSMPGNHVITGTYDGAAQTETIAALAGATVKATLPFDTITSWTGPDPGGGNTATLHVGDTIADPVCRALSVAVAGDVACQLEYETDVTVKTAPNAGDWQRRVGRIEHAGDGRTTATGLALLY